MKKNIAFFFINLLFISFCMATEKQNKTYEVFVHSTAPMGAISFDKIKTSDYLPAMREAIADHKKEIDSIANNPEKPTFENTIVALEKSGFALSRIQYVFYNLLSAESNDELNAIAEEIAPEESEHSNNIFLNEKLFDRIKIVFEQKETLNLDVEDAKLLEDTYLSFVRRGANLTDEKKEIYRRLSKELSLLDLQFAQNVLKSTNAFELLLTEKEELVGLPDDIILAAKEKAENKGKKGYLFDLSYPSYVPFLKYSSRRDLREHLYKAYNTKALNGDWDNCENVKKIVNLRLQLAQLFGEKDYASYVLSRRMAENSENVYQLLEQLLEAYRPTAINEIEEVKKYARKSGAEYDLMPWDWSYFSDKLKEEKYQVNDSEIKPYLALDSVKKGVFGLATKLYGLQFEKQTDIPVYHSEVEVYKVTEFDGKYVGLLYTDFHPREGKQGGAWMTEFKPQWKESDGSDSRPHISLVMNFSRPVEGKPALLTFDELTTFLHEFGHALHGLLADGRYASLSGTNVYRDFVELPSQIMENWASEKEFLDSFAKHFETGETISNHLIKKIKESENFNIGYACLRQLSFGFLDMAWHTQKVPFEGNIMEFEHQAWKQTQLLPIVDGMCMSVQFKHIFSGGYAAGYYGYKWAEVLDADAFSLFQEKGIFDKKTAKSFRENILSKGGVEHPMTLYTRFRGRKPTIEALLKRNNIVQ
ncbi:MAG: M3 family metallopeptidase [Paludibacteraceae bacterium]|nr:M3 family metallopeptidase [Paludibacteraceae bacterium]